MPLSPGTTLGPYEILAPLGAGGMGEVYRAHDTRLGRDVALKVIAVEAARDPERIRRFDREARAAGALNHPNVCAVFDLGTYEDSPFVVMELLEGESLRDKLGAGPIPVRKALDYAAQAARGLAAAHEKGIVHRDLKPDNLFVTKDGRVKILDFGLAKLVRPEAPAPGQEKPFSTLTTEPGAIMGTVGYMAPELVRGQGADARSDLFALGAILWEMLAGKRAFRGTSDVETLHAILNEEPASLASIGRPLPPGLEPIVRHCLEKSREERFQSAHDIAFALEALLVPESEPAPKARALRRPWRLVPALFAVVLAAALGSYLLGRNHAPGPDRPGFTYSQKTFGRLAIFQARFAPDGQTIVVSAAKEGNSPELFVIRPDYPEPHPLGIPNLHLLSVSSKGELAVLVQARYLGHRLFAGTLARMPIEGGAPRRLLEDVRDADWSPDGSGLAIIREQGGRDRLEYPIGRVLYESAGYLSDPRFSPKGDRIAFMEHPLRYDDRGTVKVVALSGGAKALTGVFWGEEGLAWSQNGREVLFSASRAGEPSSVYAVNLQGKQRVAFYAPGPLTIFESGPGGRCLVSRDELGIGLAVRAPGKRTERDLSWLDSAMDPKLSGDGRTVLFTDQGPWAGSSYNVCVRGSDGSPIVRLGEGHGDDISRDGSAVLAVVHGDKPRLMLYPTGAGPSVRLGVGPLASILDARWSPDEKRILLWGSEPAKAPRCYELTPRDGAVRPITPPGTTIGRMAPDGRTVLARTTGGWALFAVGGDAGRPISSLSADDEIVRWSLDGRSVFAYRSAEIPLRVDRVDILTGKRTAFAEVCPMERSGLLSFPSISMADDLESYAYCHVRAISTLYLVERRR